MNTNTYIASKKDHFKRLDHVLACLLSDTGLRGRRRLCENGFVFVNNKKSPAPTKIMEGDAIHILFQEIPSQYPTCEIIKETKDFVAIHKPNAMHTIAIAGKNTTSLENILPTLFPHKTCHVLNRLDYATSGMVMLTFSEKAKNTWLQQQAQQEITKTYIALTEGILTHSYCIDFAIDVSPRYAVKVNTEKKDERVTIVTPLAHTKTPQKGMSLVACSIHQGARHQIRSHLAALGHTLVGDVKYGSENSYNPNILPDLEPYLNMLNTSYFPHDTPHCSNNTPLIANNQPTANEDFFLHHIHIQSPDFNCFCYPTLWHFFSKNLQTHIQATLNNYVKKSKK